MASGYIDIPQVGGTGVISLNGLAGALTLAAGTGISITPSGGNTLTISATGLAGYANTALSNLSAVAINTSLLPGADNSINLGGAGFTFASAYLANGIYDDSGSGNIVINITTVF